MTKNTSSVAGWQAMLGCTREGLALFRISLGTLLVIELILRFRFLHPFYSNEGTLPLRLLLPTIDELYQTVCLHCHFGELWQQQLLLTIQTVIAILFTIGYQTQIMAILSWYLYTSLILRNTWLYFILDRYFYYLLFYSMFLPLDDRWTISNHRKKRSTTTGIVVSPATIALKMLVVWIYLDAGGGKYMDPKQGWTYNAQPLPALDTYTRHTLAAQYLYAILRPQGLRLLTPMVVYVELLSAPLALLGSWFLLPNVVNFAVGMIWSLHIGISMAIRNAVLLSLVACSVWFVFLPIGWDYRESRTKDSLTPTRRSRLGAVVSAVLVCGMVSANIWFETIGTDCSTGSLRQIWSTLLQNRWNVFIGAEEYVTWEIAPGRLADGSVVDVWGRKDVVNWHMPGAGAPCTSTSRPGRWRSFPYLAEFEGEDAAVLWGYLCEQWDRENNVDNNPGRKLLKFNFFMLQADVLPEMAFSSTRKRLIYSHECIDTESTSAEHAVTDDLSESASEGGLSTEEGVDVVGSDGEAESPDLVQGDQSDIDGAEL